MCGFNLKEKLIKFILATQDDETGGFADRPGDMVSWTFIHSFLHSGSAFLYTVKIFFRNESCILKIFK